MVTMRRICAAVPAALVRPARHSGRALGRQERNQQPADASQPPGAVQVPLATREHSRFPAAKDRDEILQFGRIYRSEDS